MPSTVIADVIPYLAEMPASGSESTAPKPSGVARSWRSDQVALGMTSSVSGCFRFWSVISAWRSMKLFPAGTSGQETDIPRRLTRRQNRMPILTSLPLLKRKLVSGSRISTS